MQAPPRSIRDSDQERVGTVLHDKWTLERLIGVGGMGAVYAARHRNGAKAAVKIFSPLHPTAALRERFLREGYAANKVEHSGAVKVLDDDVIDKGPDEGLAYLVMELLEGESLHDRSQRDPPLTERDLLEVALGVLNVLDAAHKNGVVHRDLKPDNLFLVKNEDRPDTNEIKVLDFGLARLLEKQEQSWNGVAFGTPTYMSPEQAAGKVADIDGRTDIYALGAILFQLSSNQRIHDAAHTLGLVVRMATTPAPKLQTVAPETSDAFASVVDRALAFDRDLRYQTAAEMREDVRKALAVMNAQPSHVNLVSTELRAPDSARVLPSTTMPSELLDSNGASFALRKTIPADVQNEFEGPPSVGSIGSIGARLAERESQRKLAEPTVAEPAVARAKEAATPSEEVAPSRSRVFSPTVLVFAAAALIGFLAFESRHLFLGPEPAASTSASSGEPANVPPPSAPSAATPSDSGPTPPSDASAEPLVVDLDDAGDAGGDAGDEEDDEDDEEEMDAGVIDAGRGRLVPIRPAARPAAKKRPPRRPGAPRKTKKKRWHW
jgi:serine/threonine-protein kinase